MSQKINSVDVEQFRGTTFFSLTPHKWGNRAKVKDANKHAEYLAQLDREKCAKAEAEGKAPSLANVAADAGPKGNGKADAGKLAVSATKRLLVSPALDELCAYLTDVKTGLCGPFGVAQQSKVLKGIYVVRNDLIQTVEDRIAEAQERLAAETVIDPKTGDMGPGYLQAFIADLPAAIERTRTLPLLEGGLGPLFDPTDYPTADELRDMFSLDSQWLALGIPDDLPPALKAKAAEKFERQMTEAAEECKDALRVSLAKFLDNLVEKLTDDPQSKKPRIFRDSLIENVRQFCQVFDSRNFLNDSALADLVTKCRAVLDDKTGGPLDAERLRKYSSVRENTREKFAEIQGALNAMIETKKSRAFDLSDE